MVTSMIVNLLKKILGSSPRGLIELYGLQDWYLSLDAETQSKVKTYYSLGMNNKADDIDTGNFVDHNTKFNGCQKFLCGVGGNAVSKDPAFAELVLVKALTAPDDNPIDRHFVYNHLIELLYKQRKSRQDAIELCMKYCHEDIDRIDSFASAWKSTAGVDLPRIPSFNRLRLIYEHRGDKDAAMSVVERYRMFIGADETLVSYGDEVSE